jgi:hypothetical protein
MLVHGYTSKKELKTYVGQVLNYEETSIFGEEYKHNGAFLVAHRPQLNGSKGREFFAKVTMENGLIASVE